MPMIKLLVDEFKADPNRSASNGESPTASASLLKPPLRPHSAPLPTSPPPSSLRHPAPSSVTIPLLLPLPLHLLPSSAGLQCHSTAAHLSLPTPSVPSVAEIGKSIGHLCGPKSDNPLRLHSVDGGLQVGLRRCCGGTVIRRGKCGRTGRKRHHGPHGCGWAEQCDQPLQPLSPHGEAAAGRNSHGGGEGEGAGTEMRGIRGHDRRRPEGVGQEGEGAGISWPHVFHQKRLVDLILCRLRSQSCRSLWTPGLLSMP